MIQCSHCDSKEVRQKSVRVNANGSKMQRYTCNDCGKWFSLNFAQEEIRVAKENAGAKRYVITSCQNNSEVNTDFLYALNAYCQYHDATLLIVPIVYKANAYDHITYNIPEDVIHEIVSSKLQIHQEIYVMGKFNFLPTTVNPLSGLESLSKGDTLIVPSPQLRMKVSATQANRHPAILHTTGAISHPNYDNTKVGEKAHFNHSYSAVLVEIDSDNDFHIRVLNAAQDNSFRDLGMVWTCDTTVPVFESIAAIVTGDEHALFSDESVKQATYTNYDSMVNVLKPTFVVRHDVLDMYSGSHHHKGNQIKTVAKHMFGYDKVEDELERTVKYIQETTNTSAYLNVIVPSNHHDHLTKWLSTTDIRTEPWNAMFYHKMMWKLLETVEKTENGVTHADTLKLYCDNFNKVPNTLFLKNGESFRIHDVELSSHGHVGRNGSRGSIAQFADMSTKYVIGHSHTPGIHGGAYQVGTSSRMDLEYVSGPSSWLHCHCLVYSNGKRQLVNIINGKWHA